MIGIPCGEETMTIR